MDTRATVGSTTLLTTVAALVGAGCILWIVLQIISLQAELRALKDGEPPPLDFFSFAATGAAKPASSSCDAEAKCNVGAHEDGVSNGGFGDAYSDAKTDTGSGPDAGGTKAVEADYSSAADPDDGGDDAEICELTADMPAAGHAAHSSEDADKAGGPPSSRAPRARASRKSRSSVD